MVQKIIWTREALANLDEIQKYIAKDSAYYAERTVYLIYESVKKLHKYPEIGMVLPTQSRHSYTLRRILIKTFKVVYSFHHDNIYIVAVFRQERQLPPGFDFLNNYL